MIPRSVRLVLFLILSSCGTPEPVEPVAPVETLPLPPMPATPEAPDATKHAEAVRTQYTVTAAREGPLVMSRHATAELVYRIHAADLAARLALGKVERAGRHATKAQLAVARDAVDQLRRVLRDGEGEGHRDDDQTPD